MALLFFIIFFFISVIFITDYLPDLYTWQSRIKIGRLNESWQKKIVYKSISWLDNPPPIRIKDQNSFILFNIVFNRYTNETLQSWQEASLLLGLLHIYRENNAPRIKEAILKFVEKKIDQKGNWVLAPKEVDAAMLAFAISEIPFIDKNKINPALDDIYELIKSKIGEDGTVMYRAATNDYRYVDTVGFICPFLVKYGFGNNNEQAVNMAIAQIKSYAKYGVLENKIPCHAYEIHTKNPVGIYGWGRGIAWFIIGVLETYLLLPEGHLEKLYLKDLLAGLAKTLKGFQKKDGSFSWNIFLPQDRSDSSATAVFAYFFSEIESFSEINEEYKLAKERAIQYIKSVTRRDGAIDFSQGDTKGIGVYSQKFNILPFTQGFVLRIVKNKLKN